MSSVRLRWRGGSKKEVGTAPLSLNAIVSGSCTSDAPTSAVRQADGIGVEAAFARHSITTSVSIARPLPHVFAESTSHFFHVIVDLQFFLGASLAASHLPVHVDEVTSCVNRDGSRV